MLTVSDFVGVETALDPKPLRDGRVAYRSNRAGSPQVFVVDPAGGDPKQLTDTGGVVYAIAPRPGHDQLLFITDIGGDEQYRLNLLDLASGDVRELAAEPDVIFNFGAWSKDGRFLSYSSNRRDSTFFDIYVLEVDTGTEHCVWAPDAWPSAGRFSPDGSMLVVDVPNLDAQGDNDLFGIPLEASGAAAGAPELLTPHDAGGATSAQWSSAVVLDSGDVLAMSDEGREFIGLQLIGSGGSDRTFVFERDWDVEAFSVSADGSHLAVVVNVDGYSEVEAFALDPDGRPSERLTIGEIPPGVVGPPAWSASGDTLHFAFVGARHPSHAWVAPVSGSARQLTPSFTGNVDLGQLPEPELVHYPTFDGRQIPGYLFRPDNATSPMPCAVIVHGGPESQSRPHLWAQNAAQLMLTEGLAIFVPNVRGSTGYGKEYEHLDDVELRMDSVRDLVACVDWLVEHADVDRERIGVVGQSYGGFMVLAAITEAPDLWAMAIDLYGIANFETFMEFTGPWRRKHRAREYGSDPEFLRSISPIHKADLIRSPLLVVQGDRDVRVPQEESEQIVATVRGNGGVVEYVVYPDEGHGIQKIAHRLDLGDRWTNFARTHLLRDE